MPPRKGETKAGAAAAVADTVAAGAIEGAGAVKEAGGDAGEVAAGAIGGAAAGTAEATGGAGDNSGGSVDNGDKPEENMGAEAGKDGEEAPPAEPGEDHETAFERRLARLVAIAEEADFESGTIVGDIRDLILDTAKAQPKGWGHMSEGERRELAKTAEKVAQVVLRKTVICVAEEDEISVHATLAGYRVNGDAFELKAKAKGDEDTAVQLFRLDGHEVVIISADSTRFHGQRRDPNIPSDKLELPFSDPPPLNEAAPGEITSRPPGDDSDLSEAGEAVAAERRAGDGVVDEEEEPTSRVNVGSGMFEEREDGVGDWIETRVASPAELVAEDPGSTWRVNLKTGMIERLPQGADGDSPGAWEDIRDATPEELAAEREATADFEA